MKSVLKPSGLGDLSVGNSFTKSISSFPKSSQGYAGPLIFATGMIVDARYGSILTVNLIRKLGELAFLARIFI
jgi:hypothetical protein